LIRKSYNFLQTPVHIAPLVVFRIIIGAMMIFSTARFIAFGWIDDHYIKPIFHFKYFGFEWVEVLPAFWMYAIHILMLLAGLCVMIGFYFRIASIMLFISFTYTELIDLTYYLNHYYFVSLVLLLLMLTPAGKYFSIDSYRNPTSATHQIPRFWIFVFQLLLAIVYTYAGLAKLNYDWLVNALPLKIWLPAHDKIPLIGFLFKWPFAPYVFSWIGMIYDCTIVFWLWNVRTRPFAYLLVTLFHLLTGILFQIGVFPLVMIAATLIFFSEQWHIKLLQKLATLLQWSMSMVPRSVSSQTITQQGLFDYANQNTNTFKPIKNSTLFIVTAFFCFQVLFPWRFVLYPGNLFWTEEGYRFSWRVMLMEKAGTATFYVKDSKTQREGVVVNSEFLNAHQEKQMAMQPDMIMQYAHFLKKHYEQLGVANPSVRAEVYVTLNAKPSELLIDPNIDLTTLRDSWKPKTWILPAPR
jgi:hypothetical protein